MILLYSAMMTLGLIYLPLSFLVNWLTGYKPYGWKYLTVVSTVSAFLILLPLWIISL